MDPGLPEKLDNGPFFIQKSQVDFGLRSSLHIKDQSRAWERPVLLSVILANRSSWRLDQSANCTVLYKVSPWLWEVVGVQSQGSSSFKRVSALKNSSSFQEDLCTQQSVNYSDDHHPWHLMVITMIYQMLQPFSFIFIINGESQICSGQGYYSTRDRDGLSLNENARLWQMIPQT